jgi:hypothetical protein
MRIAIVDLHSAWKNAGRAARRARMNIHYRTAPRPGRGGSRAMFSAGDAR